MTGRTEVPPLCTVAALRSLTFISVTQHRCVWSMCAIRTPCAWKNYLRVVAQPPKVSDGARVARQHQGCDVHLLVPNDHERSEKLDVFHRTLGRKHHTMVDCAVEAHMRLMYFTEVTGVQLNSIALVTKGKRWLNISHQRVLTSPELHRLMFHSLGQ